ncbi:3',5'-cyclic-nucleotide phosphodiesterase (EC 3.1.4.17) [uncultured Gammaproteobacteria bacterium]|nr:3',5'-cyclic-nucleotide phosphodiesterase (EC 3.1.4.17) [uncultured Gammaproteobacteria bacterium]
MHHFIQISDCHIDDTEQSLGVNTHQNLAHIIDKIAPIQSDALLISGDLTHHGTLTSYKKLKKLLAPIQSNIFVLAGNHDDAHNLATVFPAYLFNKISIGAWEIISVDSVQAKKTSGYLTKDVLLELDKQLSNSKSKYILVVLHHPIVPMCSTWDDSLSLENPQDLFTILDKYLKIQAVLFGHAHESAEFERNGLKIIACPSTAVQFTDEKRIGFNHYTLHNNGHLEYKTQWI